MKYLRPTKMYLEASVLVIALNPSFSTVHSGTMSLRVITFIMLLPHVLLLSHAVPQANAASRDVSPTGFTIPLALLTALNLTAVTTYFSTRFLLK